MKRKLLKDCLPVLLLILTIGATILMTACGSAESSTDDTNAEQNTTEADTNDTNNDQNTTEAEAVTDEADGTIVFGEITISCPDGWSVESKSDDEIRFSKTANELPFFYVENNGWVGSPETFMENEKNSFVNKYQERVEMQPQDTSYTENGKNLSGFTAKYSSEDGSSSITRCEFLEVINDVTYLYVCEYISGGYGDVHEDETTYFEFMDTIGSIKLK